MFCFRLVVSLSAFARKTGKSFQEKKKNPLLALVGSWRFSCCRGFPAAPLRRSEVDGETRGSADAGLVIEPRAPSSRLGWLCPDVTVAV